jgi:hypothetical protein
MLWALDAERARGAVRGTASECRGPFGKLRAGSEARKRRGPQDDNQTARPRMACAIHINVKYLHIGDNTCAQILTLTNA